MGTPQQTLKDIQRLLSAFPPVSGDPVLVLHNYLNAVEDFAPGLVTDAVNLTLKGELPNHDGRFAPTAPMLATACRIAAERLARTNYLNGLSAPRLPAPEIVRTAESRQRVRDMAKHAAEVIGSVDLHNSEAEIAASKERWAKVNAHFDPPQDEESLIAYTLIKVKPKRETSK